MNETVLLTGATGFVGRELLWRLARVPETRILCLIRGRDASYASHRLNDILDKAQPLPLTPQERSRVTVVTGDLTLDRLGLAEPVWDELAAGINRIVHGAASISFHLPLEIARNINVEGTRRIVELAHAAQAHGVLRRFDYISTCFVCGKRRGVVPESDLDGRYGFFNSYEQTKFEAEQLVRSSGLPYCTFRLSIVVGDSRTGYASSFKVMYWPLKILARKMVRIVPADRRGIVDLVPVDYLCEAMETIAADPAQRGKTFHLAAGPGRSSTIGEMLDLAFEAFGVRPPLLIRPVWYRVAIRPLLYLVTWGKYRDILKKGKVYMPYFSFSAAFDTAQVRAVLEPLGMRPPLVRDYFQRLINYAIASDWGKRETTL
jgi:long-chain acyl-CoA synthetase